MPRQLRIGDTVQGYTAVDHISTGMMAWAFRGTNRSGETIFLKQYKSPSRAVPWYEGYKQYQRELRRRLDDKNVGRFCVKLLDQFEADYGGAQFFQIYEFVHSGEDLGAILDRIRKDPAVLGWDQRLILAKVMMAGINQLHFSNIVHGDLKPPNLQLFRDPSIIAGWQLKLIDMDFSVLTDHRAPWHGEAGYVGTSGYLSPEHLAGQIPVPASDVFTCGLILYELLGQGHPYLAEDEASYLKAIRASRAEPIRLLGRVIDDVHTGSLADCIHRCLSADAAKRPTARDVNFALNGRLGESATRTTVPRPSPSTPPRESKLPPKPTIVQQPALQLLGNHGAIMETRISIPVGSALLKSKGFGADSDYADKASQFRLEQRHGIWLIVPASMTSNATLLNGRILEGETALKEGDIIALGARTGSGKIAMPMTIRILT